MKYKLENMVLNVNQITLIREDSGELISTDERLIAAMKLLVERYPEVVTKDELIKEIWPRQIVTDWSLTRFMSDMRKVLGDKHNIKTVHGRGYRYTYPVEPISDSDSAEPSVTKSDNIRRDVAETRSGIPKDKRLLNRRTTFFIAFGAVLLSMIGFGVFVMFKDKVGKLEPALAELMGVNSIQPVVAVLPVVDSASRYETGLAMASLLNGMLKLHNGIHLANEAAILQLGLGLDLARDGLKQQLHALCAKAGCTEVILLHYADNKGKLKLSFSHYRQGDIYLSPEIIEQNPIEALQEIYERLQFRLPESSPSLSPLLSTRNENALLAFGEATGALASGDITRATYNLEAAIRSQPDFYHATALLANLLLYRDKIEEARALIYRPDVENASDYEKLLIDIARYRLEWYDGNHQASLLVLNKAETMSERFSESISAQLLLDKGIILYELEGGTQAMDLFKQSMTLAQAIFNPEIYSHSLYCQAELLERAGETLQAELAVTKANTIVDTAGISGPRSCTQRKPSILHN